MRAYFLAASLCLPLPAAGQDPSGQPEPRAAFEVFQQQHGGQWSAQWHPATGTPSAIWGTGMPLADWRENSLTEARRHALLQIEANRTLLGVGASRFREVIGARMGRSWSFTFDQYFAGLPVIDGRIDVRINMRGIVAMLGSRSVPIPADFDVAPRLPVEAAQATAWSRLEGPLSGVPQPAPIAPSRLAIWSDTAASASAPFFLCWEVAVSNLDASGEGQVGRFYVDAKDGFVHHYRNDKHQCLSPSCHPAAEGAGASRAAEAGTGPAIGNPAIGPTALPIPTIVTLRAWTRTGADAFSALVDTPLAGIELSVPGVGVRTTNANGQITIDIAAPVGISIGALDGRHFAPISGPNGPTGFVVVNPGVATTLQLWLS